MQATMANPDIARIHDFWYSRPPVEWFMPPEGFDSQCKEQFADLVVEARAGKLDHWLANQDGTLAILVLLDQFSRNIYRGTPDAFSADPKALEIATHAIAKGWDKNATMAQALTYVGSPFHTGHPCTSLGHTTSRASHITNAPTILPPRTSANATVVPPSYAQ